MVRPSLLRTILLLLLSLKKGDGLCSASPQPSVHVFVDLLQEWVKRGVLCLFDLLHQLCMLSDKLPEVRQFLQQLGEKESVIGVIGQQMELEHVHDALLHLLDVLHVHQAGPV